MFLCSVRLLAADLFYSFYTFRVLDFGLRLTSPRLRERDIRTPVDTFMFTGSYIYEKLRCSSVAVRFLRAIEDFKKNRSEILQCLLSLAFLHRI